MTTYKEAGVNIEAGEEAVDLMKKHVKLTHNNHVIGNIGHFGGMFDVNFLKKYEKPVLVTSMDGVGNKMKIAEMTGVYTIGQCLVHHCINDILTLGATPIYFADYIASDKLDTNVIEKIIENMATSCNGFNVNPVSRLPIITGETAEVRYIYQKNQYDVAGCIIGVIEKDEIIDGSEIQEGDILIGLPSNGLHTNGYALVIKTLFEDNSFEVDSYIEELGCTIGEELMRIHRCYFREITYILSDDIKINGIAHITGGGFGNIGRLLRDGLCAEIDFEWKIPKIFKFIQRHGYVSTEEMRSVFNLGIGMVLIIPERFEVVLERRLNHFHIGRIKKAEDDRKVVFTY